MTNIASALVLNIGTLTEDVVKSSEIEGEFLDREQVRSSIARRLGIEVGGLAHTDRHVEGVVEMILDATKGFDSPLTEERLFAWHSALFPAGRSGMVKINIGGSRSDQSGPMQVISGPLGSERLRTTKLLADEALAILSLRLSKDAFFDYGRSVGICSAIGSISSSQAFVLELI